MVKYVGIDIGGSKINIVVINEKGRIFRKIKERTKNKKQEVIKQIIEGIKKICGRDLKRIGGIGIGIPGILNAKRNKIIKLPNLPGFEGLPLKEIIEKETKKKVILENDANCVAIAELFFGYGKSPKIKNLVCLTLGTGVGGGIVINKKIYIGKGNAAEFGHITLDIKGIKGSCGNYGCLEEYISSRGIKRIARNLGLEKNIIDIYHMAKAGNKKAKKVYEEAGKYLGIGLSNIVKILDPDLIVIAGGISNAGNLILKPAIKEMKKRSFFKTPEVKIAKVGEDAGAIGAASLFLNR